jgi:hypothetical protein
VDLPRIHRYLGWPQGSTRTLYQRPVDDGHPLPAG